MAKAVRSASALATATADGFFVLRTPLLPASILAEFAAEGGISAMADRPDRPDRPDARAFDRWLASERDRERAALHAVVARSDVREALYVASPSLFDSLDAWRAAPDSARGRAVEAAVFRYVQRMSARPTPFGLFAGTTLGAIADRTVLVLEPQDRYRRHTRLDCDYLERATEALSHDPELRARLVFEPNTSIYRAGGRLRFVEPRRSELGRTHVLAAVDAVPALLVALAAARGGQPRAAVAAAVTRDDPEIAAGEALEFVDELVQAGLLVPRLAPGVTGPEPIHGVIAELGVHPAAEALRAAHGELEALDARGIGQPPSAYHAVSRALAGAVTGEPPRFQVDLVKPGRQVALGGEVLAELQRGIAVLARLDMGERSGIARAFARAFSRRFEDEEVPLPIALDPELGVGLGDGADEDASSVLAGQRFDAPEVARTWSARDQQLLELLAGAPGRAPRVVELDDRLCQALEPRPATPAPSWFCAVATLHAASSSALGRGEFQLELAGFRGPSGVNAFGRFCHGDPELTAWVERHLRAEEAERPDAVFAEIVHWPEGPIGNVIARPVLRGHEIVFLARSGAPAEHQILLDDLWVSVRAGRIVLRSRRLGREVVPRLTSAHSTGLPRNVSAYRLLGELAGQGKTSIFSWSWGALARAPVLPRVATGRIVLSPAQWNLTADQRQALDAPETPAARLRALCRLRTELALPRHVALVDVDQFLPVDLDSVLSADAFLHAVRRKRSVVLVEHLGAHAGAADAPEGRFRVELQVPFRSGAPRPRAGAAAIAKPAAADGPGASAVQRVFPPGTEWCYLQLFAGVSTLDRVLARLAPLLEAEHARGRIDRWFFVRYPDPSWHLRLRLHGAPHALWTEVRRGLQPALDELVAEHGVHRIVHDTYRREIERYGGPDGIALAERVFHLDSAAVVASLAALSGNEHSDERANGHADAHSDERANDHAGEHPDQHAPEHADGRFRLALVTSDLLLAALLPEVAGRRAAIERTRDALVAADLGRGVEVGRWLGSFARREREMLDSLGQPGGALAEPLARWRAHEAALIALGDELGGLDRAGRLRASALDVVQSLVHMHLNRVLRGDHRRQEAVVYDLLSRVYRGRGARARAASSP